MEMPYIEFVEVKEEPLPYLEHKIYDTENYSHQVPPYLHPETTAMTISEGLTMTAVPKEEVMEIKEEPVTYLEQQQQEFEDQTAGTAAGAAAGTANLSAADHNTHEGVFIQGQTFQETPEIKMIENESSSSSSEMPLEQDIYYTQQYLCDHCDNVFASVSILNEHYQQHCYCKLCKIEFSDSQYFYTHLLQSHVNFSSTPVSCYCCSEDIINNDILKHMKEHAFSKEKVIKFHTTILLETDTKVKNIKKSTLKDIQKKKNLKRKPQPKFVNNIESASNELSVNKERPIDAILPTKFGLCYQCNTNFSTTKELEAHVQHTHFPRNICEICNIDIAAIPDLALHVRYCFFAPNKCSYTCCGCNFKSNLYEQLVNHTTRDHFSFNGKCNICNQEENISNFLKHLKTCILIKQKCPEFLYHTYCCFKCKIKFNDKLTLKKHISKNHICTKKNVCSSCSLHIAKSLDLFDHFKYCSLMKMTSPQQEIQSLSIKTPTVPPSTLTKTSPNTTQTCSNQIITASPSPPTSKITTIEKPQTSPIQPSNFIHICNYCKHEFQTFSDLYIHNSFHCSKNKNKYKTQSNKLSTTNFIACIKCDNRFLRNQELIADGNYICYHCSKVDTIKKTGNVVPKIKYNICVYCKKFFESAAELSEHRATDHTCDPCAKWFMTHDELVHHTRTVHNTYTY